MIYNGISFLGIGFLIVICWLFSADRKKISWKAVFWGTVIQLLFAFFIFRVPFGVRLFLLLNDIVVRIVDASAEGARFLFGSLAIPPGTEGSQGFFLAFQALPTIIFFSALMSILYFVNLMPLIIRAFSTFFSRTMGLSGAESVAVASNIFVGIESVFTIRPHISDMTSSELCTILTAGMATVASNVLALYVFTLQKLFPTIAGHLVSASILSAPAAVVMSKLLLPEDSFPTTLGKCVEINHKKESNLFEAVINGANAGVKVIAGVAALLVAVLGLVELCDIFLDFIGDKINSLFNIHFEWSLKGLFGIIFYPFSFVMGVSPEDALTVAKIVGERTVATEVAGYQDLALAISQGTLKHPRSAAIAAYALCGFTHFASMAIFVGGISALAPSKTKTLSRIGLRSLCAATLACIMTACTAGVFFTDNSILLQR